MLKKSTKPQVDEFKNYTLCKRICPVQILLIVLVRQYNDHSLHACLQAYT